MSIIITIMLTSSGNMPEVSLSDFIFPFAVSEQDITRHGNIRHTTRQQQHYNIDNKYLLIVPRYGGKNTCMSFTVYVFTGSSRYCTKR